MGRQRLLSVIHGPAFGGAHNQLLRLYAPLAERGVETTAVLPREATAAASRLRDAGVKTYELPLHRLRASSHPLVQARSLAGFGPEVRRLRRLMREEEVHLVQVHGLANPHAAIAAHLENRVAVVWQILDTRAPMVLRRATMPLILRLADAVTVWGEALARGHPGAEKLGERLITVYPPVDGTEFEPRPAEIGPARAELEVPHDVPVIGTVSVLNPQKGHEHLIRAAAMVREARPNLAVRLLVTASPSHVAYERRVRALAAELDLNDPELRFVDPGSSVARLLQAFDVFVMTSVPRSEGMPTTILEAMYCGKPVVATDVGAVRELVDDGETGFVVEPERPEAIATAILRLVDDDELRVRMGQEGHRRAVERFDLDRLADRHLHAYELAAARRRARAAR